MVFETTCMVCNIGRDITLVRSEVREISCLSIPQGAVLDFGLELPIEPRKKPGPTFHYTGWLLGILIMVYEIIPI